MAMLAAATPGDALAASSHRFASGHSQVITDGDRFAIYKRDQATLVVIDERRDRRRAIRIGSRCGPTDGAHGVFLISCIDSAGAQYSRVLTAARGVLRDAPRVTYGTSVTRIGRRWLQARDMTTGNSLIIYVQWRSGDRRTFPASERWVPRDLDDRDLAEIGPSLDLSSDFRADGKYRVWEDSGIVVKADGHSSRELARCRATCTSLALSYGVVAWRDDAGAHAVSLDRGDRARWTGFDLGLNHPIALTRRRVYLSVTRDDERFDLRRVSRRAVGI